MYRNSKIGLTAVLLTAAPVLGQQNPPQPAVTDGADENAVEQVVAPADSIRRSLADPQLEALVEDALERNPDCARALAALESLEEEATLPV